VLVSNKRRVANGALKPFFRAFRPSKKITFMNERPWRSLLRNSGGLHILLNSNAPAVRCQEPAVAARRVEHAI
jgi:hypothetical protein